MSEPEKRTWPKTPDGVTDWEAVFEDPETGLIPLIAMARSPAALRKSTIVVVERLFVRKDDPAEIENFMAELTRLMPDDMAMEGLPRIAETVTAILRQIKEDRKQKAAEFIEAEKRAQGGDRRKRVNKKKRAPRKGSLPGPGPALVWGLPLGAVAAGVAVYLFIAGPGSQEEQSPTFLLIEEMKRAAEGEALESNTFGGALRVGTRAGRTYITAEMIPPNVCASAGWVFANRGTIIINGVLPSRASPNILKNLCARNAQGATFTWLPERDKPSPR